MKEQTLQSRVGFPELATIAGTRFLAGVGLGLLLSAGLNQTKRQTVGWSLLGIGLVSTIPLAVDVLGRKFYGRSFIKEAFTRIDANSAQMTH
jgi:hypothetical protein